MTNRLVGFVLPCNDQELPVCDSFTAVPFGSIEESFRVPAIAMSAFVYMSHPLSEGVPAFFLACLGTDNKCCADLVLKQWKYVFMVCRKRGITVVSYGADGDSQELKVMQVSTQLSPSTHPSSAYSYNSLDLPKVQIPSDWWSWFAVRNLTSIAYVQVQDPVHVAVKLKAKLLKPSTVLPMGGTWLGCIIFTLYSTILAKTSMVCEKKTFNHKP